MGNKLRVKALHCISGQKIYNSGDIINESEISNAQFLLDNGFVERVQDVEEQSTTTDTKPEEGDKKKDTSNKGAKAVVTEPAPTAPSEDEKLPDLF